MNGLVVIWFFAAIISVTVFVKINKSVKESIDDRNGTVYYLNSRIYDANDMLKELGRLIETPQLKIYDLRMAVTRYVEKYNEACELIKRYGSVNSSVHSALEKQRMLVNSFGGYNDASCLFYFANCNKANSGPDIASLDNPSVVLSKAYAILNSAGTLSGIEQKR